MEDQKTWELADEYVNKLEKDMEEKYQEYKWAAMVGNLQSQLGSIFIGLSIYHPDAFKMILERMEITG